MAVELNPLELKLLRLVLDAGAHAGEAESGRQKLIASLAKRGLSHHDVVEALVAEPDNCQLSKPDYGLCQMPFGPNKGQLFMDISPHELRSAQHWAMKTPQLAQKFAQFIENVERFLNQS
jgi:hypothetical protein